MPEVLIIGAGPAGLSAAIQLKRNGVDFLLLERSQVGGLLNNANLVENYPGFPGGIPGERLVALFWQQAQALGVEVSFEEVLSLHYREGRFKAQTEKRTICSARVVVASGTKPISLSGPKVPAGLPNLLHYEILPVRQAERKQIVVVGAGDLAFDYALNLGRKNDVLILNRSDHRKCLPLLWERASRNPHIRYLDGTTLVEIQPDGPDKAVLHCTRRGENFSVPCDYLIGAVGREPHTGFLVDSLCKMASELEGNGLLYRIGDVQRGIFRQAAIAAGDGILAAMQICKSLEGN